MKYTVLELSNISFTMRKYGGSFAKQLAILMGKADYNNLRLIVLTWKELMEEYNDPKWNKTIK